MNNTALSKWVVKVDPMNVFARLIALINKVVRYWNADARKLNFPAEENDRVIRYERWRKESVALMLGSRWIWSPTRCSRIPFENGWASTVKDSDKAQRLLFKTASLRVDDG